MVAYVMLAIRGGTEVERSHVFTYPTAQLYAAGGDLVVLDQLPLTPPARSTVGPWQRRRHGREAVGGPCVPPRDALEAVIAEVWCEVLGSNRWCVHDTSSSWAGFAAGDAGSRPPLSPAAGRTAVAAVVRGADDRRGGGGGRVSLGSVYEPALAALFARLLR